MKFAKSTTVSPEKSKCSIEKVLRKYGADQCATGWNGSHAAVSFRMSSRMIRFSVPMPSKTLTDVKYQREERQRWRALLLVIKAKLEAVDAGISLFEEEFMAHIVLPGGVTVGDFMKPQIEAAYKSGKMPLLLELK